MSVWIFKKNIWIFGGKFENIPMCFKSLDLYYSLTIWSLVLSTYWPPSLLRVQKSRRGQLSVAVVEPGWPRRGRVPIACASKMMMILILLFLVSKFIEQDKMVNKVSKYSDVLGMAKTMITMHLNEGKLSVLLFASSLKATNFQALQMRLPPTPRHFCTSQAAPHLISLPRRRCIQRPATALRAPSLPSPRFGHTTFVTAGQEPLIATCAGHVCDEANAKRCSAVELVSAGPTVPPA